VRAREHEPFSSVEDLERVSGIGPKTRMRIERWVLAAPRERNDESPRRRNRNDG
jgi:hypothetical protein